MATTVREGARADGGAPARSPWRLLFLLLRHPRHGWGAIAATPMTTRSLVGLAVPLTAIGAIAHGCHALLFGAAAMGIIDYRPTLGGAILTTLVGWVAALVATLLLALAVDLSAPWFGGTRNRNAATKVAVFGASAWWLASGFALVPAVGFLQVLGLYSLILIVNGAPLLMRVGADRGVFHGLVAVAAAIVLLLATLGVGWAVQRETLRPTVETANGREVVTGAPAIPGSRLIAPATDRKRAGVPQFDAAAAGVAAPNALQALLPARVGEFARTSLESQSNLSAGSASADAKATYVAGTDSFTLTVADAGTPGALATNNSVIAGEVNRVTDSGYQRSQVINGIRVIEKWSNADHGGNYSRTVAGRFTIEAQGTAPTVDTLRAAVNAVDERRLTALAR